jgi:hypothetical protein
MANTTTETAAKQLLVEAGRDYDRMVRDPLYRVYEQDAVYFWTHQGYRRHDYLVGCVVRGLITDAEFRFNDGAK